MSRDLTIPLPRLIDERLFLAAEKLAGLTNRDMNNQLQIYLTACELLDGAANSADTAQVRTRWSRLAGGAERKLRAFVSQAALCT